MSRPSWQLIFNPAEEAIVEKIDQVRKAKGMTKKGLFFYSAANLFPELATEIVDMLMTKPHSKTTKLVKKDIENEANRD